MNFTPVWKPSNLKDRAQEMRNFINECLALTLEVQRLSRAVQVFSAMAMEATLNTYDVVRFGQDQYNAYEKRSGPGPQGSYAVCCSQLGGIDLSSDHELIAIVIVERLARRRNDLVHQLSDESSFDQEGKIHFPFGMVPIRVDAQSAEQAVADLRTFLRLFAEQDREAAWFLGLYE